jgi:hypothetical protein
MLQGEIPGVWPSTRPRRRDSERPNLAPLERSAGAYIRWTSPDGSPVESGKGSHRDSIVIGGEGSGRGVMCPPVCRSDTRQKWHSPGVTPGWPGQVIE